VFLLVGCVGLLAAAAWYLSQDEFEGRQMWILGTALLALASSCGLSQASLAWGLGAVFAGGFLFLATIRNQRLAWFMITGLVAPPRCHLHLPERGRPLHRSLYPRWYYSGRCTSCCCSVSPATSLRLSGSFSGLERWVVLYTHSDWGC
jgi:hypothetical protein